jgi:hypothetical protein
MFEILEGMALNPVIDAKDIGEHNALIIDTMAVIQMMNGKWKTFAEFADSLFSHLVKLALQWKATRLDFVADRYPEEGGCRKVSREFTYLARTKASPNSGRNI